eukprot:11538418-Alexandrium_andersonii.AAC.1
MTFARISVSSRLSQMLAHSEQTQGVICVLTTSANVSPQTVQQLCVMSVSDWAACLYMGAHAFKDPCVVFADFHLAR